MLFRSRLEEARRDLDALRLLGEASRRDAAARRWREAHGDLPRARLGPLALTLGPTLRARHDEHAPQVKEASELAQHRSEFAASVGWLDMAGTKLVSVDRSTAKVWEVSGQGVQLVATHELPRAWVATNTAAADPGRGALYVAGTARVGSGRRPSCLLISIAGIHRHETITPPLVDAKSDRMLTVA